MILIGNVVKAKLDGSGKTIVKNQDGKCVAVSLESLLS